jgi:hypothetical protein
MQRGAVLLLEGQRNAGPFDSRLNSLFRPKAGGTYSDASLRMTLLFYLLKLVMVPTERSMQIHSPIRLACGSLRVTPEFSPAARSG